MAKSPTPEVPGYGKIEPTKGFDKETNLNPPDRSAFESYMNEPLSSKEEQTAISPEELKRLQINEPATINTVAAQFQSF